MLSHLPQYNSAHYLSNHKTRLSNIQSTISFHWKELIEVTSGALVFMCISKYQAHLKMGRHLFPIFFSYITDNFLSFVSFSLRYQPSGRLWKAPNNTWVNAVILKCNVHAVFLPARLRREYFGWLKTVIGLLFVSYLLFSLLLSGRIQHPAAERGRAAAMALVRDQVY